MADEKLPRDHGVTMDGRIKRTLNPPVMSERPPPPKAQVAPPPSTKTEK
jgi:hypothetical protein